jgi:ATP-dependent RNA helicase SUPV3L1/SUV3
MCSPASSASSIITSATVLKPLDDLSRAEDLQGLAKGLAFQLVENLGVLFRRDVTEDVKSLDQDARASMRRYGIRFGAYHVFVPALLKPAPAELITLLWALKNDGLDKPVTAISFRFWPPGAHRSSPIRLRTDVLQACGFRFLGKRAVRIDILERLADLIRPLLQWKPGQAPIVRKAPMTAAGSRPRPPCSPFSAPRSTTWKKSSRASAIAPTP